MRDPKLFPSHLSVYIMFREGVGHKCYFTMILTCNQHVHILDTESFWMYEIKFLLPCCRFVFFLLMSTCIWLHNLRRLWKCELYWTDLEQAHDNWNEFFDFTTRGNFLIQWKLSFAQWTPHTIELVHFYSVWAWMNLLYFHSFIWSRTYNCRQHLWWVPAESVE